VCKASTVKKKKKGEKPGASPIAGLQLHKKHNCGEDQGGKLHRTNTLRGGKTVRQIFRVKKIDSKGAFKRGREDA